MVSVSSGLPNLGCSTSVLPLAVTCAWVVSVAGRLPLRPRLCQSLEAAGCLSALGPPGPRPPTATRRAPPSTSEGAYGSETVPPPPDSAPSGPSPCSCPVVDTPARRCISPASALRDHFYRFRACKSLSPTARDRFHHFRASRRPSPAFGPIFAFFCPASRFPPPPGTVFTDFGPVDGHSLPRGHLSPFSVPSAIGPGKFHWQRR